MFGKISKWFNNRRELSRKKLEERLYEIADDKFDVSVYGHQLWFVHNGELVCPVSMFNSEATCVIENMRKMYVEKNTKNG